MPDIEDRCVEAAGDAVCAWHVLDLVLASTCESRDVLEENGLDELVEDFSAMVERVEEAYAAAEKKVVENLDE